MTRDALLLELEAARAARRQHEQTLRERDLAVERARRSAPPSAGSTRNAHQGLGQRTPDEVHFGKVTAARAVPLRAELVAEHLDGDRDLPVLRLRRVA